MYSITAVLLNLTISSLVSKHRRLIVAVGLGSAGTVSFSSVVEMSISSTSQLLRNLMKQVIARALTKILKHRASLKVPRLETGGPVVQSGTNA